MIYLVVLSGGAASCAAEGQGRQWDGYLPGVFKRPEAVALARNPFLGQGRSSSAGPGAAAAVARNSLSMRLSEQLRRGVHGLVVSGEHPCLLYGSRIIAIGQKLELQVDDQTGRRTVALRLRSVSRDQLAFLTDEAGARLLGSEEWACSLQKESLP